MREFLAVARSCIGGVLKGAMRHKNNESPNGDTQSRPVGPAIGGAGVTSQDYWSNYNVLDNRWMSSSEESLKFFEWRVRQYYDYLEYMPVAGLDGKDVLDYGCGPGHDLVGIATYSRPNKLIGIDVSKASLEQARHRLGLHGSTAELHQICENDGLPLEDASIDYVHCSGVLHHVPDPVNVLAEFRRVLRPNGIVRLMVYNYDSIWFHLFSAYLMRFKSPGYRDWDVREIFRISTDTADCPISQAWKPSEIFQLSAVAGFGGRHLGNAVAVRELSILDKRFEAILEVDLEAEHRDFLLALKFDERGVPLFEGVGAGIDGCYELRAT
jgi:SAM-dependent methyltransferase